MKCLQNKDRNSHIFRFQCEYGAILQINTVNLPLCLHRVEANSSLLKRRKSEGRAKDERRTIEGTPSQFLLFNYKVTKKLRELRTKALLFHSFLGICVKLPKAAQKRHSSLSTGGEMILSPPLFSHFKVSFMIFLN